jgi:hypothetical protein
VFTAVVHTDTELALLWLEQLLEKCLLTHCFSVHVDVKQILLSKLSLRETGSAMTALLLRLMLTLLLLLEAVPVLLHLTLL